MPQKKRKKENFLLDLCYINRIKSNKNNIFVINKQIEMSSRKSEMESCETFLSTLAYTFAVD